MLLPIIKVPCILVATVGLHVAATPPEPPPAKDEVRKSTSLEILLKQRWPPVFTKCIFWGTALAEVAVLLAQYMPGSLPGSDYILQNLIFHGGAVERISPSGAFFVGSIMMSLGGFIRYKCYKALGPMFTYEMSIRKDHKLVTSGPYNVVRHPGYTGVLLTAGGLLLLHGSKGSWIRESGIMETTVMRGIAYFSCGLLCTVTTGLLRRMPIEDEALHHLAGSEWEDWARRVPYKLIPWIY